MNNRKSVIKVLTALLLIIAVIGLSGCSGDEPEATPTPTPPPPTGTPPPSTPEPTPEPVVLAPYSGIIEHIFFHEVIAWPELAFRGDSRQANIDAEYITATEFWNILGELHANNYVLIDLNDVYSEYMTETGHFKMRQNTLELPTGKKPLVISFDNMNFSENNVSYGFMSRYIIGLDGLVSAEGTDPDGNHIVSRDLAAITLLDKFVEENPDFSHNGAKGCLALTGSQGILGYRTSKADDETPQERIKRIEEVALVTPVIRQLKETGWYFASHTYSRTPLGNMRLENIQNEAERWQSEVGSLVGETKILTYPASSRLDGGDQNAPGPAMQYYVSIGFRYFASYGTRHYVQIKSDNYNITAVIADRAFICGTTLRNSRTGLGRFFDVADVFDNARPSEYGTDWGD